MFAIAHNSILRDSLAGILQLSPERVFDEYRPPPFTGNLVVGVEDLRDANLRFAVRYFLANVEKNISLFIVKQEWSENDEKFFDDLVKTEYRRAHDLNQVAIDRVNKLPENDWKTDRLEQLNEWRTIPAINYSLLTLNDNLKQFKCYPSIHIFSTRLVILMIQKTSDHFCNLLVQNRKYSHIFQISFVPFGTIFFKSKEIEARVFDATVFCSTALKYEKVGFRVGDAVHHVDIAHIFPDGTYPSLSRLLSMNPPSPKFSRPDSVNDSVSPSLISEPPTPGGLAAPHNRGRRVSFGQFPFLLIQCYFVSGTIKLMSDAPSNPEIPILNGNDDGGVKTVDAFIDKMLQQTMDQLAV
ncbi:hypothetical protein CRE_30539 [Caenorhabditis remanei]|uniref:Uncharacterized protein n=1 Tax=Caenorhabditis remanei TaxID=31234 RepID=E3NLT6_CAERE|nr:hypothetical protein CRE_30539 [Caenorhabditis remanei]